MILVFRNVRRELHKAMSNHKHSYVQQEGFTLEKIARRSSWKRDVEVHQLAGKVILRPLYPFDSTAGGEEPILSSAGDMFSEEIKN